MTNPKARAWVQRILSGPFRPDDLSNLFEYARDHCDGRESVAEIGHFVAHHYERDKGITTRMTREWCAVARYHMPRFLPGNPPYRDPSRLPPSTREYFKIAINRIGAHIVNERTGLRATKAFSIMNNLAERLVSNPDGTWALPPNCTAVEISLVECVTAVMVIRPAFEPSDLHKDFIATLKSNGLITNEEIRTHSNDLRTLVELFAVSVMHNNVIIVSDSEKIQLKATNSRGKLAVNAELSFVLPDRPNGIVSSAMFESELNPVDHCHPSLLLRPQWDCEIELGPDKRLSPLT